MIHYPIPPHKQLAYTAMSNIHLPVTERIHNTVMSLPMDPSMTDEHINKVIKVANEFKNEETIISNNIYRPADFYENVCRLYR